MQKHIFTKCFLLLLKTRTKSLLIVCLSLADGLKEVIVNNYEEISARMEEGNVNRTIASTNMNATSSRAHTIVGIR